MPSAVNEFDAWFLGVPDIGQGGSTEFDAWTLGVPLVGQITFSKGIAGSLLAWTSSSSSARGRGNLAAVSLSSSIGTSLLAGTGKVAGRVIGIAMGTGHGSGRLNFSASGFGVALPSAHAQGTLSFGALGFGEAIASAHAQGTLTLAGLALDWALGLAALSGTAGPTSVNLSGRIVCFSFGAAGLLARGIIRVPQDLLPGDRVHVGSRCCPGDRYLPVMEISRNRLFLRVAVLGIGQWIPMNMVRSAVRPTRSPDSIPSSIIDPPGYRTHL